MEEAERLCDRVAIIEHGRIIAMDSPEGLIKQHCPEVSVSFSCDETIEAREIREMIPSVDIAVDDDKIRLSGSGEDFISDVIQYLSAEGVRLRDLHTHRPNLEDVFLKLTGHSVRE